MIFEPDDRVLIVPIREHDWIAGVLAQLPRGLLVGVGEDDKVRAARRAFAASDNTMFLIQDPDGAMPWRNAFFSVILCREETAELRRVLHPSGKLVID